MDRTRSQELFSKAQARIPGGVNSPVRAFMSVGGDPVYFKSGLGGKFVDADGNEYVDLCLSWGPLILGHAHPAVVEAVIDAARAGLSFGACHEREIQIAELILSAFPYHEKVRLVSSGTEAVMTAVRLARGVTGRPLILKFDGCYHGHVDGLLVKAGSGLVTQAIATSQGIPESITSCTLTCPLDDELAVREIFRLHGQRIAAAIIEPLPANSGLLVQRTELLELLRELTRASGSILIFDEVISGFRLTFGGYAGLLGITPDMTTLGKIIGGGMPVGAVLASAAVMDQLAPLGKVYQAGTLSGNPVALAAGLATLNQLSDGAAYVHLEDLGWLMESELRSNGIGCRRVGSIVWPYLSAGEPPRRPDAVSSEAVNRFNSVHRHVLDRGYYMPPSAWEVCFLCTSHTPEQIRGFTRVLAECLRG